MSKAALNVSKGLQEITRRLDENIQSVAGERLGFTLIIFTGETAQYSSNCDRSESVREIRQMLDYWEKGMPDVQFHKVN